MFNQLLSCSTWEPRTLPHEVNCNSNEKGTRDAVVAQRVSLLGIRASKSRHICNSHRSMAHAKLSHSL